MSIKRLKRGKAVGCDEIANEYLIEGRELLSGPLTKWFNQLWAIERVPEEWQDVKMTMLHKGGSKYVLIIIEGLQLVAM